MDKWDLGHALSDWRLGTLSASRPKFFVRGSYPPGYDTRTIPHTNLCKWVRPPQDPERFRGGMLTNPSRSMGETLAITLRSRTRASYTGTIPARYRTPTSANGYDPPRIPHDPEKVFTIPFTIPRDPEEKHSQRPHDPAERHPVEV